MSTTIARDVRESRRGLTYQVRGEGAVVVLVHGWCLDRTVWLYQEQELLSAGFQVVSPDLAGYGESRGLSGPLSLDRHGADIADLIEEIGEEQVTVVGFAFGAAVLLNLPDYSRVSGIVSIGIPNAAGAPYAKMRSAMLRDWPLFAQRSAAAICAREHSAASMEWLGGVFARTPLNSALGGVDVLARFEPLDLERSGRVRTLFVHGSEDRIVSPEISRAAAAHFTAAELLIVAESGHFVPWDQPAALSSAIVEFAHAGDNE